MYKGEQIRFIEDAMLGRNHYSNEDGNLDIYISRNTLGEIHVVTPHYFSRDNK